MAELLSIPRFWMSLPDDLLLSCIARVSRRYYPSLSLVSKRFRSLIVSPALYKARSLLGHTESCLYVCLGGLYYDDGPRWFTLSRKPDQTNKEKKSSGYFLARVSPPDSPLVNFSGLVAVGFNIYNIAGSEPCAPSSTVWIMDCGTNKWREAPSLQVKLLSLSATVVDQKIYVVAIRDGDSLKKMVVEVFDTETEIWDIVPIPYTKAMGDFSYFKSACIDGKFHLMTNGSLENVSAYNSKERRWDLVGKGMGHYMRLDYYCVINNVLYSVYDGFRWYDTETRMWRELKGLVGLPKFRLPPNGAVKLADYGGKMAVLWEAYTPGRRFNSMKMIWCAEVALERRNSCEIWGKVEWFDHVLTVPTLCHLVKVLAATV